MSEGNDSEDTKKCKKTQNVVDYIFNLSKEMNVAGTQGVMGNELELIALVRNCRFLYDKRQFDFKNIRKKNAAWNAIATVMNAPVQDVQQRWRCLRDTYNKYKKEIESDRDIRLWEFYEDMKFIDPYIVRRSSLQKLNLNASSLSGEESEDNLNDVNSEIFSNQTIPVHMRKFITEVKSRPLLYDRKHADYKNKELKQKNWKEISNLFGIPVDHCEIKWKRLRERYVRERKHLHKGTPDRNTWPFFDSLSFLDAYVRCQRLDYYAPTNDEVKLDGLKLSLGAGSTDNVSEDKNIEFVDINPLLSDSTVAANGDSPTSRSQLSKEVTDQDDLFGQLIAAELKAMPRGKKKMKLKADMYRLLYENESDS